VVTSDRKKGGPTTPSEEKKKKKKKQPSFREGEKNIYVDAIKKMISFVSIVGGGGEKEEKRTAVAPSRKCGKKNKRLPVPSFSGSSGQGR